MVKVGHAGIANSPCLEKDLPSVFPLFCYPNDWDTRRVRRIQAWNLRELLLHMETHTRAIEEQKLLALKAEEIRVRLLQEEYSGMSTFDEPRLD